MKIKNGHKGQSALEYAVIIAVVVAALIAIQIYMKRGVQGKLRDSTDQIGEQFDAEKTTLGRNTTRTGNTVQTVANGVTTTYSGSGALGSAESRTESGTENIAGW